MLSIAGCRQKSKKNFTLNTPAPSFPAPSIQSLKQEYAALEAENKKLYPNQKKARAEMMELLTVKHNTSRILGLAEEDKQREQRQEER